MSNQSNINRALEMAREISQMDTEALMEAVRYLDGHIKARSPEAFEALEERVSSLEVMLAALEERVSSPEPWRRG